ncbi:MAG: DUF502 domain-containing protein [Planctomycetaceae bacterium]|nr:DUF502 domain-containing protein [Planctomycetaceae bacterium]
MTKSGSQHLSPTKIFLRGLAISLPTILTLVILLWLGSLMNTYIISPTNSMVKFVFAQFIDDSVPIGNLVTVPQGPALPYCDHNYRVTEELRDEYIANWNFHKKAKPNTAPGKEQAEWLMKPGAGAYVIMGDRGVPYYDYEQVSRHIQISQMPRSRTGLYMELVVVRHFPGFFQLSAIAISILIILIYMLGRFVTVKVGAWFVSKFESIVISSLPVVRNVYSSIKQVTDFLFSENQVEVRKVVAFQYPSKGIWSLGFVTGESLIDIAVHAGEPCVSILVPTSPMPMTGYTMSVPKSEIIDLDISVDQAFQFIVSCGVLVPPQQTVTPQLLKERIQKKQLELQQSQEQNPDHPESPDQN